MDPNQSKSGEPADVPPETLPDGSSTIPGRSIEEARKEVVRRIKQMRRTALRREPSALAKSLLALDGCALSPEDAQRLMKRSMTGTSITPDHDLDETVLQMDATIPARPESEHTGETDEEEGQ